MIRLGTVLAKIEAMGVIRKVHTRRILTALIFISSVYLVVYILFLRQTELDDRDHNYRL